MDGTHKKEYVPMIKRKEPALLRSEGKPVALVSLERSTWEPMPNAVAFLGQSYIKTGPQVHMGRLCTAYDRLDPHDLVCVRVEDAVMLVQQEVKDSVVLTK